MHQKRCMKKENQTRRNFGAPGGEKKKNHLVPTFGCRVDIQPSPFFQASIHHLLSVALKMTCWRLLSNARKHAFNSSQNVVLGHVLFLPTRFQKSNSRSSIHGPSFWRCCMASQLATQTTKERTFITLPTGAEGDTSIRPLTYSAT